MNYALEAHRSIEKAVAVYRSSLEKGQAEIQEAKHKQGGPDSDDVYFLSETMAYDRGVIHGLRLAQTLVYNAAQEAESVTV